MHRSYWPRLLSNLGISKFAFTLFFILALFCYSGKHVGSFEQKSNKYDTERPVVAALGSMGMSNSCSLRVQN